MNTPEENKNNPSPSLLDQIIQTANTQETNHQDTIDTNMPPIGENSGNAPLPNTGVTPKKPRDPMTAGTILKLMGSFLVVAVIFFGSFLAYIAFNPEQAGFFVTIFGINPSDIRNLLKQLINGSFGSIVLIFSIIWIISLFRAIWTPKDQKRRRLVSWLSAGVTGVILFSILAFWAYLFGIINATDYANPGGEVSIYDNDLYTHPESREYAAIASTNHIIGPITLRYDISTNAKSVSKKNLLELESYDINFDGAKCSNEESRMTGSDPMNEQGIICTFDQIRSYNIRGSYTGRDRLGGMHTIIMPLKAVDIKGLIDITSTINVDKKRVITINASKVKNLGNPRWIYSTRQDTEKSQASITEEPTLTPLIVCLKLLGDDCDRYFMISENEVAASIKEGSIVFQEDSTNSLGAIFTLTGVNINNNEIVNIDWMDNNGVRMCQGTSERCEYVFGGYGQKVITATVYLANKKSYSVQGSYSLNAPLIMVRHAQVFNQENMLLNSPDTFDPSIGGYIIKNITIPTKLILDARDVILENSGYKIRNVTWKISDSKKTEEKIGEKVDLDVIRTERYTIEVLYTFEKSISTSSNETRTAKDLIVLDLDRKGLEPVLNIQKSSDYTPSKVTIDASSSQSKNGTIQKFLFDFGEGKPQTEGDAIQTYEYRTAGEKKITLTIIDDNNEQATISKYIVLKDTPKSVGFTTSMSPGVIAIPVDFIGDGSNGQIEEWIWNFGDNTPIARGYEVTHTYTKSGSYNVTLTVRYVDGTEKSASQPFQVVESLE